MEFFSFQQTLHSCLRRANVDAYFSIWGLRSVNVNMREWDRTQILKVDVVYFICLDDVVTSQNSKKCLVQTYPSDIFAAAGDLYYSVLNLRLLILWEEERERERVVRGEREQSTTPFSPPTELVLTAGRSNKSSVLPAAVLVGDLIWTWVNMCCVGRTGGASSQHSAG